jgi:putative oxidoreductase
MTYRQMLTAAGILSMGVAAFHVLLAFSADLSAYFGAGPKITQMLRNHDPQIYLLMVLMIAMFALWGLYGLSGAGRFARLPLLKTGLFVIGAIYTLRGIAFFPEMLGSLGVTEFPSSPQNLLSSAVSLITGLCYLFGTIGLLRRPVTA